MTSLIGNRCDADEALIVANEPPSNSKPYTLLLPYAGQKGEHLKRPVRKDTHQMLPENTQPRICYTWTKLGAKLNNINGPAKKSH